MKSYMEYLVILAIVNIIIVLISYYIFINPIYDLNKYIIQTLKPCCSCCCFQPTLLSIIPFMLIALLLVLIVFDIRFIQQIIVSIKKKKN